MRYSLKISAICAKETGSFLMVNDCSMENGSCQTHLNFTRLCVLVNKCFSGFDGVNVLFRTYIVPGTESV